jgi:hypothetical protein
MSVERIFYCDGPDCDRHVKTARTRPEMFLTVSERGGLAQHFCGWDCVLRHAAAKEPEHVVAGPYEPADYRSGALAA